VSQPVRLDQMAIALAVVVLFGIIGYQRGLLRELVAAPAILIAPFVGPWLGEVLKPWVNRFHKLFMFVRFGGLGTDDWTAVLEKVRSTKALVSTPEDEVALALVFFMVVIACGYCVGQWRVRGPTDRPTFWLGALMGALNGYVLAQVVLPRFWSAQFAVIIVPTASVLQLFHGQVALALVLAFVVLVIYALRLARRR
jgi:hypothetical protein